MDNYNPARLNRYWKRPKLRVYDCNVRDAERFYQDSYKQYLSDKEDAARRAARARSIDSNRAATEFYPHLLAGSFPREAREDVTRQLNLPPLPPALVEAAKTRWEADHRVPETSFTARQEGLADFDPRDTASIEERYQKLRKLREELNLPAEGAETSALGSLRSGSVGIGGGGGGYGAERDSYKSEKTSRTVASAGGPDDSSSYSFRSERTARMNGNAGGGEGYRYKSESSTNEYKRGGDQNSYDFRMRSDRGGDQNASEYRYRSERGAAGDQNSLDYKSRFDRGGDHNSLDYKPRSELGGAGEQNSYEYRLRSDRGGGGDQNSYEYKFKSERGGDQTSYEYKPRSERGTGEVTSSEYKYRSDRGGDSSDYKSRFELKSDDYKAPSRAVDFDLPKSDRKKDDYSFSSSTDRKTDRYSSLSSSAASASASASTEKKSLASSSKDDDKEADDDNVSDMMKKLPSSQEILERISKMELDD